MPMHVELVSPERVLMSTEASMVLARTIGGGDIAFLPGHAPFIGALAAWVVEIVPVEGPRILAAVHREPLLAAVLELHPRRPRGERAQERRVVLLERDVAAAERAHDDHLGLAGIEHLFGGYELHFHRMAPTTRYRRVVSGSGTRTQPFA